MPRLALPLLLLLACAAAQAQVKEHKVPLNPGTFSAAYAEKRAAPVLWPGRSGLGPRGVVVVVRALGPDRVLVEMPLKETSKGGVKRGQPAPFVLRRPSKGLGKTLRLEGDWRVIGETKVGADDLWELEPVPKKK
jgi:hypothetical protein